MEILPVHSTLWKYSTSRKFILYFVYLFRTDRNFLSNFCSSDPSFARNILRPLYLKFKKSTHAQMTVASYYLQISWHDMNLKLTWGMHFDKLNWLMILSAWLCDFFKKCILVCKLFPLLLPNLLRLNVNVIAGVCVFISFYCKGFSWLSKTINLMPEISSVIVCWGNISVSKTFVATSETFELATVQKKVN